MKIGVHGTRLITSVARATAALGLVLTVGGPTSSFAGDVAARPASALNIAGSTGGVSPQPAAETGWLSLAQPSDSLGVVSSSTGASVAIASRAIKSEIVTA